MKALFITNDLAEDGLSPEAARHITQDVHGKRMPNGK
jgi:hypothetical protein